MWVSRGSADVTVGGPSDDALHKQGIDNTLGLHSSPSHDVSLDSATVEKKLIRSRIVHAQMRKHGGSEGGVVERMGRRELGGRHTHAILVGEGRRRAVGAGASVMLRCDELKGVDDCVGFVCSKGGLHLGAGEEGGDDVCMGRGDVLCEEDHGGVFDGNVNKFGEEVVLRVADETEGETGATLVWGGAVATVPEGTRAGDDFPCSKAEGEMREGEAREVERAGEAMVGFVE